MPTERVSTVVGALRVAIDSLFLDGYTIFAPPFTLTYPSDPVAPVFASRIENAPDSDVDAWFSGNLDAAAEWLGIPATEYKRHPIGSALMVLTELFDALDIQNADSPEGAEAISIAEAWFDTFAQERPYRLSSVGLERDLEAWLIHHTERLGQIGYDVRLRHQQLVLPDRRRPDLVFDLIADDGSSGTLVVELKATGGYLAAVDQLVGYMDAFRSLGLPEPLRGLLVADGFSHDVLLYADEQGIDTATLTELGYRRDLATVTTTKPSPQTADTEPEASMKTFIIYSIPSQGWEGLPVMYVVAADVDSVPTDIRPYDADDPEQVEAAAVAKAQLTEPHASDSMTVGKIAVSWGGITYADGSPVETAQADVPSMEAERGVYLWEATTLATEAGAAFLRAVWELRKDITVIPPRMLADYLRRNPEELRGDGELPDHIEAAADAFEGLPRAAIDWETPDDYDGSLETFLSDAERVFKSVATRLLRLAHEGDSPA